MTAFWYLFRNYARSFISVALVIAAIVIIVDGIDQYTSISGYEATLTQKILFVVMRVPQIIYTFFPLIFLVASLSFFLNLSRNSELVALRAAGVSAVKIVLVPVIATLVLSAIILGPYHFGMVKSRIVSNNLEETIKGVPTQKIRTVRDGMWVKENIDTETRFIHVPRVNWRTNDMFNVEIYRFRENNKLERLLANKAILKDSQWQLTNVQVDQVDLDQGRQDLTEMTLESNLNFEQIFDAYTNPRYVTLFQMPKFISGLAKDGYDVASVKTLYYSTLALPISYGLLCIIGAIFALAPMRGGGTSLRVILAIASGLIYYFLGNLTDSLAKAGEIPIVIGVLALPLAGCFFAISLLLHQEDG